MTAWFVLRCRIDRDTTSCRYFGKRGRYRVSSSNDLSKFDKEQFIYHVAEMYEEKQKRSESLKVIGYLKKLMTLYKMSSEHGQICARINSFTQALMADLAASAAGESSSSARLTR